MPIIPESLAAPRRAGQLASLVAGLTLLAAAGCSSSGSPASGTSHKPQASAAAPSSAAAAGGTAGTVTFPAKIGDLRKQFDDPGVGAARSGGIPAAVLKNLRSVTYGTDSNPTQYVAVVGGPGMPVPAAGPGDPVQRLMVKFLNDPKISATTSMPVGSAGGTAECTTDSAFKNGLDCGWVNGTTALTLSFNDTPLARAKVLMPQILSAMTGG